MELFLRLMSATVIADLGAGVGALVGAAVQRRLHTLIWAASGVMLAVVLFDVVPESAEVIGLPAVLLAVLSGASLLAVLQKTTDCACPACSFSEHSEQPKANFGQNVALILGALGVHSFLDGLALVTEVNGHQDLGLLVAVSLHKLPEGLALTLLLLGAGLSRRRAFAFSLAVESFTVVGGLTGRFFLHGVDPFWPAVIAAHVGGGFLYLVWMTARKTNHEKVTVSRMALFATGCLTFLLSSAILLVTHS